MKKMILFVLLTVLTMSCRKDENSATAGYTGKWHPYKAEGIIKMNGQSSPFTQIYNECEAKSFINIMVNGNVTGESYRFYSSTNECLKDSNVSGTYHDETKKLTLYNSNIDFDVSFVNGEMILKYSGNSSMIVSQTIYYRR